jgi:outer membrane protein OmpA-like peptidoglycan-associated protein
MRQFSILALATALSIILIVPPPRADACGVKLTVKTSGARKASARMAKANRPVRANEPREVVTARVTRQPVAAGPEPERQVVSAKPVEMQTKPAGEAGPTAPAEPQKVTPETIQQPKVADAETKSEPKQPEPKPEPKTVPPPPKRVATATPTTSAPTGGLSVEIFYGLSSAKIRDTRRIDKAVKWMTANPDVTVVAEGHADPSGTHDGNMALSQARAEGVRDALVAAGVDSARIEVQPFGDTKLRYGARDGRNRRVFLHVKKD